MANTYWNLFYHIVFSRKGRVDFIDKESENRVWAFIGGLARKHEMIAVHVGGIENHIHLLILAKPKIAPSQIVQWIKGESSKWIHDTFPELKGLHGRTGSACFRLANQMFPMLWSTSKINANIIISRVLKTNMFRY